MTNKLLPLLLLIISAYRCTAQHSNITTGYFNNDDIVDTLLVTVIEDTSHINDPITHLKLHCGAGKVYDFDLDVGNEALIVNSPRNGVIETYFRKGGNSGFEREEEYRYFSWCDDWLLVKITEDSPGYRQTVTRPDGLFGISGREYPMPTRDSSKPRR